MDPDLAVTIGFCLEVLVFALVFAVYVAHEVRGTHAEVAREPESTNGEKEIG
jgi:hypothetical protein